MWVESPAREMGRSEVFGDISELHVPQNEYQPDNQPEILNDFICIIIYCMMAKLDYPPPWGPTSPETFGFTCTLLKHDTNEHDFTGLLPEAG